MKLITLVIDDSHPWVGYTVTAFIVGGRSEGHEGYAHSLEEALALALEPLEVAGVICTP